MLDEKGRIMSDRIRYATGDSSLGPIIAAVSDRGLVAFEFAEGPAALRARFPEAELIEDAAGLAGTLHSLAALVDTPALSPSIPLDMRGSDYQKRVWDLVRAIPAGETRSYGAIAAQLGTRDARDVTDAIASNGIAVLIPCHRVVKKDGVLSGYRWGVARKRVLLAREREAVPFRLA
jgi:AraC family transcriptional regulator, regulatory protein of adaptative response / methylated-DNA-[protein]-cysteine methyltransferase